MRASDWKLLLWFAVGGIASIVVVLSVVGAAMDYTSYMEGEPMAAFCESGTWKGYCPHCGKEYDIGAHPRGTGRMCVECGLGFLVDNKLLVRPATKNDLRTELYRTTRKLVSTADGWKHVNVNLEKKNATTKSFTFLVSSYTGGFLPPIELALAPSRTRLFVNDKLFNRPHPERNLWVVYEGEKKHVSRYSKGVSVGRNCIDSPCLWLDCEMRHYRSECTFTVEYSSSAQMAIDACKRVALEKTCKDSEGDFNQPIKIMDLPPTNLTGTDICWDLVVRCYPAWNTSNRWMPDIELREEYINNFPPRLSIVKQSEIDKHTAHKLDERNDPVRARTSEEYPKDLIIWRDDEQLLSDGSLKISLEKIRKKSREWRRQTALPEIGWKGGGQLYIQLRKNPYKQQNTTDATGVAVRVILRLRLNNVGGF